MASDDPNAKSFSSRPVRRPPTLDLKAQEVRPGAAEGARQENPADPAAAVGAPPGGSAPAAEKPGATTSSETKAGDMKPGDPKPAAAAAGEAKAGEAKAGTVKPGTAQPAGGPGEAKSGDIKPGEVRPAGAPVTESKPAGAVPAAAAAGTKPADPKAAAGTAAKPADAKPADAKPADAKPAANVRPGTAGVTGPRTAAAAGEPPQPAAAARSGGAGIGIVIAALVAGLIGGGAAGGGVVYYLQTSRPALPQPVVDLAPLTGRIAALEGRPAVDPQVVAGLGRRLDQAESGLKTLDSGVAALQAAPPATDASATDASATGAPAASPELARTMDELKSGVAAAQQAHRETASQIAALRSAQAGLQSAVGAAASSAQQAQALGPRIDALGARIEGVQKAAADAASSATHFNRAAGGMVVLAAFRDAVVAGRPFARELTAARTVLGTDAAALEPFAAAADKGYATPARLADQLAAQGEAAVAVLDPIAPPQSDTLVGRFMSSAGALVKVRPADSPDVVAARSILARAALAVRTGDLETGLYDLKQLPPAVQRQLADVAAEIEARRRAVEIATTLYQQSLAAISGKAQ